MRQMHWRLHQCIHTCAMFAGASMQYRGSMCQWSWRLLLMLNGCGRSIVASVWKCGYFDIFFEKTVISVFNLENMAILKKKSQLDNPYNY